MMSGFFSYFFCCWGMGMPMYAIVRIFRGPIRSFVYRPGQPALTWTARRSVNGADGADGADGGVESHLVSAIAAGEVPIGCQTPSIAQHAPYQCHANAMPCLDVEFDVLYNDVSHRGHMFASVVTFSLYH